MAREPKPARKSTDAGTKMKAELAAVQIELQAWREFGREWKSFITTNFPEIHTHLIMPVQEEEPAPKPKRKKSGTTARVRS